MCEPTMITAGVMMVSSVYTAQQQRAQAKAQGSHQQGVAEYNARVTENEATQIRNEGVEQENIQRRKTSELQSKQRAQLAARNIDLTTGSALQLQDETEELGEVDALRIRSNTDNRVEASLSKADLTRRDGAFANQSTGGGAFGTLLSGAGAALSTGVADKWFTPDSSALAGG